MYIIVIHNMIYIYIYIYIYIMIVIVIQNILLDKKNNNSVK